jgi:hypothetical protein
MAKNDKDKNAIHKYDGDGSAFSEDPSTYLDEPASFTPMQFGILEVKPNDILVIRGRNLHPLFIDRISQALIDLGMKPAFVIALEPDSDINILRAAVTAPAANTQPV